MTNTVSVTETTNTVTVNESTNTVTVNEGSATVITVSTQGPQGATGAAGSSTIDDDSLDEVKLNIHADPSGTNKFLGYTSNGMEWAVPPDTQYSVGDNGLTKNNFTDALKTKLDSVESNSTADMTGSEIKTAYEAESDTNAFTDTEKTKLSGIATSANNYAISSDLLDEDNMSSNSAVKVPSQQSVKAYVDANSGNTYTAGTGLNLSGTEFSVTSLALTTVQEAANESAQLSLTTQEGDVVVRTDENKTYVKNSGSSNSMSDFTLLRTPTDAVLSVNGNTGAITAAQIASAVESAADSHTFSDADHTKLNGIATGAEVNVQSDWNETSNSSDAYIQNKPTIPTNTDTTYGISCVDGDNTDEEKIRLTAGGDGSGTDDVVLEAGTGLSIARSGDKITFTNTVTDTNTQLTTEEVQDIIGAMVAGNTETNISVTYDDTNGKLDFVSTDTNTTYSVVTSSANGLAPQLPASHGGKFLKADGTWEVPPDTNTTYSVQDGQLSQNSFTDADHTKLDGIEASADVTDATNVDSAGAIMNSDLSSKGDILIGDGSGDPTALAVGTNDYVLTADSSESTGVKWAAASGGGGSTDLLEIMLFT